jgi:hypothetical protein
LTTLARTTDWLGDGLVLVPPRLLRTFASQGPTPYDGPLIWLDHDGNQGVALRTWRIRNTEGSFAEPVECVGSDLVVRPDLVERLEQAYRVPIHELRVVTREPVPDLSGR